MIVHQGLRRDIVAMSDGLSAASLILARYGWTLSLSPGSEAADSGPDSVLWRCSAGNLIVASSPGSPGGLIVEFPDLARAEVSRSDRRVRVSPLVPGLSRHDLGHFISDILLPRLVAEDGPLVVHGALLSRDTDAVCLVGDSGRGKSTLSAALQKAGWTLHGDDALHLRAEGAEIGARATYPSLRLFSDSLDHLFPDPPADLSPVADYLDKFRLAPDDVGGPAETPRLRAVLLLEGGDGTDAIAARPVTAVTLCMSLLRQSFSLNPADPVAAHERLTAASAVTAAVPGFALSYPREFARLPEVVDLVRSTLDRVGAAAKQEMAARSGLPGDI